MARLPLLLFPQAEKATRPRQRGGGDKNVHTPDAGRQAERLASMFSTLQASFEERRVELQSSSHGLDPEQVLVLETVGRVDDFYKAISKIEGLDWLGEHDIDQIPPDNDFYDTSKPEKKLRGRVYLMMSNQQSLRQMRSLWEKFQRNPGMKFKGSDFGLAKIKDIFLLLKDVRRWGISDRLLESELLQSWLEDLKHDPLQPVEFEIELWFRKDELSRQRAETGVRTQIQQLGGRIITSATISEIRYHSMLAELPRNAVEDLISDPNVELVKNDAVMLFRPTGQMASKRRPTPDELSEIENAHISNLPQGPPIVAVLDGCPLLNHKVLADRIIFDDPDDYASTYPAPARHHGTAMCSLVIRGDLSVENTPLNSPVYCRPIFQPFQNHHNQWREAVPQGVLLVDLIHRAVRRIFESDRGQPAVAPSIKVINLSLGDPYRPFDDFLSPLARLLDWLSEKYRVLFVVSAGNHARDFDPGMPLTQFRSLLPADRERHALQILFEDARNRRLLSPAESVNAVTVGASHSDNSTPTLTPRLEELYASRIGSPISAFGSGYRRAIKPDVLRPGGRVRYAERPGANSYIYSESFRAPGIKVAAPGPVPGEMSRTVFTEGTSNAAALLTHDLGLCYENLTQIAAENGLEAELDKYGAPILKTLAVHCADWNGIGDQIRDHIRTSDNGQSIKRTISRWIGYGDGEIDRVLGCAHHRATAIGFAELSDGDAHIYRFPVPAELSATTEARSLRVTLAWLTPIAPSTQRYRSAYLWFDVSGNGFASQRQDADGKAVKSGTVQHELFAGNNATVIDDDAFVEIRVNCKKDVGKEFTAIPYGIAVTLEVKEGVSIPVYQRVSQRIRQTTRVRT